MTTMRVYDPAMCCSTGVCGPTVDPRLPRFAADLEWLASRGVTVERFNLAQQPGAFASDTAVRDALAASGEASLPLIQVNGTVKSTGAYPSRDELAAWAGVDLPAPSLYTDAVAELVALGAAIAANCEPCFKFHFDKARKLGVSREDMRRAVATAQSVKDAPAKAVLQLADRFLAEPTAVAANADSGCCATPAKPVTMLPLATTAACCTPAAGQASETAAAPGTSCC